MDANPYAPSAVVDPRQEFAAAGIGAWRDGDLLVVHRDVRLPDLCLKTGRPATRRLAVKLAWDEHWWSLRKQTVWLEVPLCEWRYFVATRVRWLLVALGIAALGLMFLIAPQMDEMPVRWAAPSLIGAGGAAVTLLLTSAALGEPVAIRRVRGDYLWLGGPGERFLKQLPAWTGPE